MQMPISSAPFTANFDYSQMMLQVQANDRISTILKVPIE